MRVPIILSLISAVLLSPSCRRDHDDKKPVSKHKPSSAAKTKHDPSKEIEALTGAHTRLVWAECAEPKDSDTYATGDSLLLIGLDTRDGLGERAILSKPGNYARPLLTSDGTGIVFSDKNTVRKGGKKYYEPVVYRTDWKGDKPVRLAEGYAVDCWKDPATGTEWVFAAQEIRPTKGVSLEAQRLVRFPMNDPEKIETVYDETPISPDNVQFSRDGTEACGLFPWPHAGILRQSEGKWKARQLTIGCWTSHSPDNSGVLWAFDGDHKSVHLYADDGARTWQLGFSDAPGVNGRELYHPRWSNHPRFIVATGPYIKQKGSNGSVINKGGATAQVLMARLSPTADKVEAWVQVSDDKTGESYPDAWIEGGDQANLEGHSLTHQQGVVASAETWPAKREGLLFLWRDRVSLNTFVQRDGHKNEARIESHDAGRFGRFQEMQLDGGSFEVEAESAEPILKELAGAQDPQQHAGLGAPLVFEAVLIPQPSAPTGSRDGEGALIFSAPGFRIAEYKGKLFVLFSDQEQWITTEPVPTAPFHLVVSRRRVLGAASPFEIVFINGKQVPIAPWFSNMKPPLSSSQAASISFGGGWSGGLLNVALYARSIGIDEIARAASAAEHRIAALPPPPPRVRLRGKLVELSAMPTPGAIEPYTSSLVEYVYEVEKVLEGEFKEPRVLVKHWAMLNLHTVRGLPREVGKSYELTLEPAAAHLHLQGERVMQDTTAFDLQPWFDVSPPRVVERK
jgi:hypothetical protein